jgi:very-short-patch-repair endonuclease
MVCSKCGEELPRNEFNYSVEKYRKPLCRSCQQDYEPLKKKFEKQRKRSTPEAMKLYEILVKLGIPAKLEQSDGFKHIDIAIPELRVNIEVDGEHHNFSEKQALADLKRTYYSFKKGYVTLRIPNKLIQKNAYETAKYIKKFLESSEEHFEDELDDEEDLM